MVLRFFQGLRRRNRDGPPVDPDERIAEIRAALRAVVRDCDGNLPYPEDPDAIPEWWHLTAEMCTLRGVAHAAPATRRDFERQVRACEAALAVPTAPLPPSNVILLPEQISLIKHQARDELVRLVRSGAHVDSQKMLCERWGVDKGTVSRWITEWERAGLFCRVRQGRNVVIKPVRSKLALGRVAA